MHDSGLRFSLPFPYFQEIGQIAYITFCKANSAKLNAFLQRKIFFLAFTDQKHVVILNRSVSHYASVWCQDTNSN